MIDNYLYIGIGSDHHYYTLRESWKERVYLPGGDSRMMTRHLHHYNLSQNADEAFAKAMAAAASIGLPLLTKRDGLEEQLEEIKRATAEEVARRERVKREEQESAAASIARYEAQMLEVIAAGFVPVGRYAGEAIENLPADYMTWMVKNADDFEGFMAVLAKRIADDYSEYLLPTPDPKKYLDAEVKTRVTLEVTLLRKTGYESQYGWVNVVIMVTDDGTCIVHRGAWRPEADPGARLKIVGSIMGFNEYNGQAQTRIGRVKEIKE